MFARLAAIIAALVFASSDASRTRFVGDALSGLTSTMGSNLGQSASGMQQMLSQGAGQASQAVGAATQQATAAAGMGVPPPSGAVNAVTGAVANPMRAMEEEDEDEDESVEADLDLAESEAKKTVLESKLSESYKMVGKKEEQLEQALKLNAELKEELKKSHAGGAAPGPSSAMPPQNVPLPSTNTVIIIRSNPKSLRGEDTKAALQAQLAEAQGRKDFIERTQQRT